VPAPSQPTTCFGSDNDDDDDEFEDAAQDELSWQERIKSEKQAAVERSQAEVAAKQHAEAMQARQAAEREAALRTAEEEREVAQQEAEARALRAKETFERRERELAELSAQREEAAAVSRSVAAATWANQYDALSRKDMDSSETVAHAKAAWGRPTAPSAACEEENGDFPSLGKDVFPSLGPASNTDSRSSNSVAEKFGLEAKRTRAERKKERERLAAIAAVEEAKAAAAKAAAVKRAAAEEAERQVAREQAEAEAAVVRMREAEQLQAERARLQEQKAAVASTWAAKYEAVATGSAEDQFPGLPTKADGVRKTGWGRTGAAAGTEQLAAGGQSAASGAAAFPTLGEAFPSLPAPVPAASRTRGTASNSSGSAPNAGYSISMGRKGRHAKGMSSTQRKKAKKKRIAAGEWTKLEKVRCLCENNGGCTVRARFPEDGRWYDATLDMHVGNQYKVTYVEYDDSGLLTLDDLQVDEAWLAFEYSTSFVVPRTYGESDDEDDEGYGTADDETEEPDSDKCTNGDRKIAGSCTLVGHHVADAGNMDADAHSAVVVKNGVRDQAVSSGIPGPKPEPAPDPEPETPKAVYSPTAAANALNAFLSSIGGQLMIQTCLVHLRFERVRPMQNKLCVDMCVLCSMLGLINAGVIPVADGEEEIDEYVLEYLSGYIGECHASGEDCSTFLEVTSVLVQSNPISSSPISRLRPVVIPPVLDPHVSHASVCLPSGRDSASCLRTLCGPFMAANQRQLTKSLLSYTALRQSRTVVPQETSFRAIRVVSSIYS
jgi:hypothetical protein